MTAPSAIDVYLAAPPDSDQRAALTNLGALIRRMIALRLAEIPAHG